jgi:hypothetical protein
MIDVAEFIRKAADEGVLIALRDDRIVVRPKGRPILVDIIRKNKSAFINYLQDSTVCGHPYTAVEGTPEPGEDEPLNFGVCLACGFPWGRHGCPPQNLWSIVNDLTEVTPIVPLTISETLRAYCDEIFGTILPAEVPDEVERWKKHTKDAQAKEKSWVIPTTLERRLAERNERESKKVGPFGLMWEEHQKKKKQDLIEQPSLLI